LEVGIDFWKNGMAFMVIGLASSANWASDGYGPGLLGWGTRAFSLHRPLAQGLVMQPMTKSQRLIPLRWLLNEKT
jgi:hypothetical protein